MENVKNEKAIRKREVILNGNLWTSILIIGLPILFYNLCNYLYGIYDMMVVQSAHIGEAADIVVLDQIVLDTFKTKGLVEVLKAFNLEKKLKKL